MNQDPKPWKRAIILVDMNAFFASVEQLDNPHLRGKPVVVTNGSKGSCIITASYEARAFGVKTGMRLREARECCPNLIRSASRPRRYAEISSRIMQALQDITPDIEVFSVDEAFLDITRCQSYYHNDPISVAKMTKQKVWDASSLHCSVGLSGDKTTAKYAAKLNKPDGLTIIPPWEAKERLKNIHVTELCGIAHGIGNFLAQHGVQYCGEMEKLPMSILAKRFGNLGRRIWYMCQGADPEPVKTTVDDPKSMGHGKVLPPNTSSPKTILTYLQHMSEKLAARLRRYGLMAKHFFVGLKTKQYSWYGKKVSLEYATDDGRTIFQMAKSVSIPVLKERLVVIQVQITALDPYPYLTQGDLFYEPDLKRQDINKAIDHINKRYGEFFIAPANLLGRSEMPNVIAPAWKPDGARDTIGS